MMDLKSKTSKGVCSVVLQGDMSIYHAAQTKDELLKVLTDEKVKEIEINLNDVGDMDTAGMQLLVMAKQASKKMEKPLSLVGHSQSVLEVFQLYNMESFFGDPLVVGDK